MKDDPEQFQMPQELRDVIRGGRCVAFIGSGLSVGSYPSWSDLVNGLCKACGSSCRVGDDSQPDEFLDAAQDAKSLDEIAYFKFLGEVFGPPADQVSLTYDAILSLPFDCYVTVNLDRLLALKSRRARPECAKDIHAYPALDRKTPKRSIHYLHGFIRQGTTPVDGTIVLARTEFDEAYDDKGNLMNFLVPTLENDPIVFIGCRLREPVMPRVFAICKQHQQRRKELAAKLGGRNANPPKRFILLPRKRFHIDKGNAEEMEQSRLQLTEDAYYRDMDIEPVRYPVVGGDHWQLRLALERLADLRDIAPEYGWSGGNDVI